MSQPGAPAPCPLFARRRETDGHSPKISPARARGLLRSGFRFPPGGEVIFLDNGSGARDGFIELLPVTPGMDETFTRFWKASLGWDGNDPVRSFL